MRPVGGSAGGTASGLGPWCPSGPGGGACYQV